jgi:4-amino-4-deoxy-L-arabinose transferase-like glycosyltransferase
LKRLRLFILSLGNARTIGIIFLVGLTIRVGVTLVLGNRLLPMADQPVFLDLAENVAQGRGLSVSRNVVGLPEDISDSLLAVLLTRPERMRDEQLGALWGIIKPDTPTAFFEPFYPLFVGGIRWIFGPTSGTTIGQEIIPFGPKIIIVRLFQSLFDALVILILYYLGKTLFTPVVGGLAALIYCFYPYSIAFVTNIVTQNTYLFLQAVMVYFFVRAMRHQSWGNYLGLGLAAGLTLLTRISLISFIPLIIICLYLPLRKELKWGRLGVSMVIMVLAALPWMLRNQAALGQAILLPTKGGRNLWEYNNQNFLPERMEGQFTGVSAVYQKFALANYEGLNAKELLPFPNFTTESEIERDRILNQRVMGFIRANPWVFVKLCVLRLYQLFRVQPSAHAGPLVILASWGTFGWIFPAAFVGLILSFNAWRKRSVIYALVLYTVGTAALTASGIPHRVPTDPYFILLAAFALVTALKLENTPKLDNPNT